MYYHVVMMRLAEAAGDEFHRRVAAHAARVRAECDGVLHYDCRENTAPRAKGFTHAVVSLFESPEAHHRYQHSAAHQEMKAYMLPFIADIVECNADIPDVAATVSAGGAARGAEGAR